MLPKINRLPKNEITHLFRAGKRINTPDVTYIIGRSHEQVSRFAFVVSKKVAKRAVDRNRIKRVLRESVHSLLPTLPSTFDAVLIAQTNFADIKVVEVEKEMKELFFGKLR